MFIFRDNIRPKVVSAKEKGRKTDDIIKLLSIEEKAFLLILFDCQYKVYFKI